MRIRYEWRGEFEDTAVNALHAEGFGGGGESDGSGRDGSGTDAGIDWGARVQRHSLGWVCAWEGSDLVGFVNVIWDGGAHAFVLDTVVAAKARHRGIGTGLIGTAARHARATGCQWLHVDFEDHLAAFYFRSCGFTPTSAGLIALA